MNTFKFQFIDDQGERYYADVIINDPKLVIDDAYIIDIVEQLGISNIAHCYITIAADNMALIIKDYTVTKSIHINGFFNTGSYISMLQSVDVDLHITGQQIKHLQADCKNILVANCKVEQFEIGLFKRFEPKQDGGVFDLFKADNVDIRDAEISVFDIFAECKRVSIERSRIKEIMFQSGMLTKSAVFDTIHIWYNTTIDKITISNKINHLKIANSRINWFHAHPSLCIDQLEVEKSIVDDCYGFSKSSFSMLSSDSWLWIGKSAQNALNSQLRAEASYEFLRSSSKSAKGVDKLLGKIFDFCAGYGYKPIRILRTSGLIILTSTMIYSVIDLIALLNRRSIIFSWTELTKAIVHIGDNLLLAAASIVGQGYLSTTDGIAYWITILEALLGVVLFATFVNALYLRYKD